MASPDQGYTAQGYTALPPLLRRRNRLSGAEQARLLGLKLSLGQDTLIPKRR